MYGVLAAVSGIAVVLVLVSGTSLAWWGWLLVTTGAVVAVCFGMVSLAEDRRQRNALRAERGLPPLWWGEQDVPRSALVLGLVGWGLVTVLHVSSPIAGSPAGRIVMVALAAVLTLMSAVGLVQQGRRRRAEAAR